MTNPAKSTISKLHPGRYILAACIALSALPAYAQDASVLKLSPPATPDPRTPPDPARAPQGALDFGFAIAELCFPYLLDDASSDLLSQREGLRQLPQHSGEKSHGVQHAVTFGNDSPLITIMRQQPSGRSCVLQVNDTGVLPTLDLMQAIREWPIPLKIVRAPVYDDIDGAMSTMFCAVNAYGGEDIILISVVALEPHFIPLSLEAGFMRQTSHQALACDPDYFKVDG